MASRRHLSKLSAIAATALASVAVAAAPASESENLVPPKLPTKSCAVDSPHVPVTIRIGDGLQAHVEAMLHASSTFRDQCRRLAESPAVRVTIRKNAGLQQRSFRAISRIERFRSGLILAVVEITPSGSPAEWIAHEFEHILEQMDGWKLSEMVAGGAAWRSSENMFETARAIRAGRRVADELRRARRAVRDKLVE
jgi:hypothetical protein